MMQSILEIRHLRTLAALRDTGSLVRAAQLLNLTQSALSHQIKLLEERYGAQLFERKSVPPQFSTTGCGCCSWPTPRCRSSKRPSATWRGSRWGAAGSCASWSSATPASTG